MINWFKAKSDYLIRKMFKKGVIAKSPPNCGCHSLWSPHTSTKMAFAKKFVAKNIKSKSAVWNWYSLNWNRKSDFRGEKIGVLFLAKIVQPWVQYNQPAVISTFAKLIIGNLKWQFFLMLLEKQSQLNLESCQLSQLYWDWSAQFLKYPESRLFFYSLL